ncbi:restriction endonuclease subunit S [Larkinella terrae]|uniref:Type I restriction modification DNA specificity domain-containing protein n=1 Tax=Larkinella terrae TaxID=2025311 RepID=A0A7K0ED12_9BACT|nr:restriction endonuclease subunit S [Larkinella terrae]MRS59794.1 hypothetical protein [Larkinella terrae]
MIAVQSKVPTLRFPEFEGEWNQHKLEDFLDEYIEKVPAKTEMPVLTSSRTGLRLQRDYFNNRELDNEGEYKVVPKGYMTYRHMSDDATFKFNINNLVDRGAISKEYPVFTTKNLDSFFLQQLLNQGNDFKEFAILQKQGGTRTRLYFKKLKSFITYLPSLPEQQKIVAFLTAIDAKTELIAKKKTLLEQYKKGVMQQIFSQEIRFKDDNGNDFPDWEEKRLGELFTITSSKRVFESEWTKNGVPFYRTREIVQLSETGIVKNELFISVEMFNQYKLKYGVPKKDDLLVTGVGTIGRVYVVKEADHFYFKDGNIIWLKTLNKVNSIFVEQLFKTKIIQKQIENNASITTVGTYTIDFAKKTKLPYPSLPEQLKISNFLTAIDAKINAVDQHLRYIKIYRKALFQQLFV